MLGKLLGAAAALLVLPQTAIAADIDSAFTTFDADKCRHEKGTADEDYGAWTCPGYGGLKVLLSAGDQRMQVTFGATAGEDTLAASQTFPGFNDVYKGTVEWRIESVGGKPKPFAAILRWNVMTEADQANATGSVSPTGRVLVVTRLGPGSVCHVGYVDARANKDPNLLARRIADDTARAFRCGVDKAVVVGAVTPGLAMPD